jgi:hypothetical protein
MRVLAVILCLLLSLPAGAQGTAVDIELAFVVDASGSIDTAETRLQRQGYADALKNPQVLSSIAGGLTGGIAVAYIEFAANGCEKLSVPWTRISDVASATAFGDRILALPPIFCPGGNAIGDALVFAAGSIQSNAFNGVRRVIDLSGDGPNTVGGAVEPARDLIVASGITINGLVIDRPSMPNLEAYFRGNMTGGPGSFVIKAESRETFGAAILKKMILEIAGEVPANAPFNAASARRR